MELVAAGSGAVRGAAGGAKEGMTNPAGGTESILCNARWNVRVTMQRTVKYSLGHRRQVRVVYERCGALQVHCTMQYVVHSHLPAAELAAAGLPAAAGSSRGPRAGRRPR